MENGSPIHHYHLIWFCFFFHSHSLVVDYNVIDSCGTYTSIGSWLIHDIDDLRRTRISINMILNQRMELTCESASAGRFLLVFYGTHFFVFSLCRPYRFSCASMVISFSTWLVYSVGNTLRTPHFDPYNAVYCNGKNGKYTNANK